MKNIWYVDSNGGFQSSENSSVISLYDMLQRLQTFKGEQSFNAQNGIDYFSVFNRQAFLKPQIEAIQNEYIQYFRDITNEYVYSRESITVNMRVTFNSGAVEDLSVII